jgi:hypothetical protein
MISFLSSPGYQPLLFLDKWRRWRHPRRGLIPPLAMRMQEAPVRDEISVG